MGRPRILLTAYGCAPDRGSQPAVGPEHDAAEGPANRRADRLIRCRRRWGAYLAVPVHGLLGSRARRRFGILMYHRVAAVPRGGSLPDYLVPVERFRRQMQGLLSRGYTPWPLRKAIAYHAAGRPIPPRTFVLTFDDGYECLYYDAWPVLRELRIPATVFLVTSYLDSNRPLLSAKGALSGADRTSCPLQRSLSTAQCHEMQSSGLVELGSHSHTHADFRGRPSVFRADLEVSLDALRARFDLAEATFAFPFGHCGKELVMEAENSGFLCALTAHDQLVAPGSSPFDWGRFSAEPCDTAATLAAKLDGWYSALQAVWHRWRQRRTANGTVCP